MLLAVRIEIDDDQNDVIARRGHFSVTEDRVVVGGIETQVVVKLKRTICPPNPVQARDPVLDVAGRVPIALFELILFRIEILLPAGQRFILAKFVSAVDAVKRRKRRSQNNADDECRAPAVLKKWR